MPASATVQEQAATYGTPPSREVLELAQQAVRDFHECFWWWDEKAEIKTRDEVRQVVENLRKSGGHRAWWTAQKIHKCL
ncbi:MAG: hypothetical protein Q8M07_09580 [Prosthecobacter sp.]|nr:hypothetical protein [Prosthecobacter sp.]